MRLPVKPICHLNHGLERRPYLVHLTATQTMQFANFLALLVRQHAYRFFTLVLILHLECGLPVLTALEVVALKRLSWLQVDDGIETARFCCEIDVFQLSRFLIARFQSSSGLHERKFSHHDHSLQQKLNKVFFNQCKWIFFVSSHYCKRLGSQQGRSIFALLYRVKFGLSLSLRLQDRRLAELNCLQQSLVLHMDFCVFVPQISNKLSLLHAAGSLN